MMNRFTKDRLWQFAMFCLCGFFFSCVEDGRYYPGVYEERAVCNVPKFYDDKQGSYKGAIFLIESDSVLEATSDTVKVNFGNYANKTLEIKGFPIKYILQKVDGGSALTDIPSSIVEKQIKISFRYFLYGYLTVQTWPSYKRLDGDSIDSNFSKSLYVGIKYGHELYSDSIYNEDKTLKLKYEVHGVEEEDSRVVIIGLRDLELNGRVLSSAYYIPVAKIKIGRDKIDETLPLVK